jgi:hypothetical protein
MNGDFSTTDCGSCRYAKGEVAGALMALGMSGAAMQ